MPRSLRDRAANKAESINQRLSLYSAAAVTAGVSVLALAQPAEGSVVVTKTNITVAAGTPVSIDLNKDGIKDFMFSVSLGGYDHSFYAMMAVIPLTGGKVVGGNRGSLGPYASALAKGANVGPSAHFSSSALRGQLLIERSDGTASAGTYYRLYGKWGNVSAKYLGVKFLIKGAVHYGWVRMTVSHSGKINGTITEYAYETVAGKKVGAGNTTAAIEDTTEAQGSKTDGPSIGMLALGADGLALWRRE